MNVTQYTNIREVIARLHRNPLLRDVTVEQAVEYFADFIAVHGYNSMYEDREDHVKIENYRGKLPCAVIRINQVKDIQTGRCLRATSSTFYMDPDIQEKQAFTERTFKTQGDIIFTSFKEGELLVSYKTIPLDDDGFPKVPDNQILIKALEAYIKKEAFTILFDLNRISANTYHNAQQQYGWLAGQLRSEMQMPTMSEMESIKRMWTALLPRTRMFDSGFTTAGESEYLKGL